MANWRNKTTGGHAAFLSTVRRASACLGGLPDHRIAAPRISSSTIEARGIILGASAGSTTLPTRTSAILLAFSPTRSSACLAVAAGKSCRAGQTVGRSVGRPAGQHRNFRGVSSYPHQLKTLGALGPKPQYLGDPTLLLCWAGGAPRSSHRYVIQQLVYPQTRFAEPRHDVTVTPAVPVAGQDFGNVVLGLSRQGSCDRLLDAVRAQLRAQCRHRDFVDARPESQMV